MFLAAADGVLDLFQDAVDVVDALRGGEECNLVVEERGVVLEKDGFCLHERAVDDVGKGGGQRFVRTRKAEFPVGVTA